MTVFTLSTKHRGEILDITDKVADAVRKDEVENGVAVVFVPHTTAGVTINENADPSVREDIESVLGHLVPWSGNYAHSEGNTAAHVKASLMGFSVHVPVEKGRLALGTWQGIQFCEFDGPRSRRVCVQVLRA